MPAAIWGACGTTEIPWTENSNALRWGCVYFLPAWEPELLCRFHLCGLTLHCALIVVTCVWVDMAVII